MPVVQVPIYFSKDIARGLANGSLEVGGLVVRNAVGPGKGQIVRHVPIAGEKVAKAAQAGAKLAQANPAIVIGIGAAAAVGAVGPFAVKKIKRINKNNHNKKKRYVPPEIKNFWRAVNEYKKAGEKGIMSEAEINNVIKALDDIDKSDHRNYLWSQLSAKSIYDVFKTMQDYTNRLAKANGVSVSDVQENKIEKTCNIIDLRPILKEQKRVFEMAG